MGVVKPWMCGLRLDTVSASNDMSLRLWSTADEYKNVKTLQGHDHTVSAVKFTPSGDHVVSASRDKTVRLWEVATGWVARAGGRGEAEMLMRRRQILPQDLLGA